MQQIDALMHSRIANLSYAKYGRRDMQEPVSYTHLDVYKRQPAGIFMNADRTAILPDKLYLLGDAVYTGTCLLYTSPTSCMKG